MTVVKPDTNIVMMDLSDSSARHLEGLLAQAGVRVSVYGPRRLRLVTHLGVSHSEVSQAAETIVGVAA